MRVGTSVVDMGTAMWTALGILAALRERDRTGEGTRLSGALFDTALAWSAYHLLGAVADGTVAPRFGTQLPMIAPYGTFPTSDGEIMVAVGTDALFARLCRALTLGPLHEDPRFVHNPERVMNREELNLKVSTATRRQTADGLLLLLREAGVPCAPVLDVGEILADEQFRASGMMARRETGGREARDGGVATGSAATGGAPLNTRLPLRWDGERFPVPGPPPRPGAHTREVLEELGLEPRLVRALLGETEG